MSNATQLLHRTSSKSNARDRRCQARAGMKTISSPIRLVPQTAQPIDFSCPLCGAVHAAYFFSHSRCKVYRCGGCGLTFANPIDSSFADDTASSKPQRADEEHRAFISLLGDGARDRKVLAFADRDDSI